MTEINLADTRPTKEYLVHGITQDVSIEECIFDLIDNSIDAYPRNSDEIMSDYDNYTIDLTIQKNLFSIDDQGKGINKGLLEKDTLRFGTKSDHHTTSIGFYGIGLNRALFKLGKKIDLSTETDKERSIIRLDVNKFLKDNDNWSLPIIPEKLKGIKGTSIKIENLNSEINENFSSTNWINSFSNQISIRYSEFLKKNLKIRVNGNDVKPYLVSIRNNSGFKELKKEFTHNGIKAIITLGQSSNHFFSYEDSYNYDKNATPKDCGWFVYCNDRAVKLFDWTPDTGWYTKFHNEHNGFIGKAYFIGNAGKLPWNTSKTDIDLNNEIYKKSLETMKNFSEEWRKHTNKVLKRGFRPITEENPAISDLFGSLPMGGKQPVQPATNPQPIIEQAPLNPQPIIEQAPLNPQPIIEHATLNPQPIIEHATLNPQLDIQQDPLNLHQVSQETKDNFYKEDELSDNFYQYDPNYSAPSHIVDYEYLFNNKTAKVPFFIPNEEIKLKSLLAELVKIRISTLPIATIMLIRAFLELSCDYYSRKFNVDIKTRKPSLSEIVSRCLHKMEEKQHLRLDSRRISTLHSLCNERKYEKGFLCIQNLQITLHSEDLIWDKGSILSFWYTLLPFLTACYNSHQR
ncbi:hypothetical protein C9E88_013040 [Acinetobacter cumulans]|uniref:ATP-binding protein n=1 Tax=Acinetobacter cumulans TaxID=2136182 RepID=UPI000D1153CA|nr:ATP-binding protein [Acinetobacter cumulans]QCO22344.1 hypothetical protein C9E88_013040 [Acinetobacter cumulans]